MHIPSTLLMFLFQDDTFSGQIELNAATCQGASRSFLITCVTIALAVAVVAVLLKRYWDKRQSWSPGMRLGLSVAIAFVVSSALVAWNPVKPQYFLDCIQDLQFSRFVMMGSVAAVPRGLVLGGLISVVLYFVISFILGLIGNRR